jgi:predicted nucleotidyltransferase component of viral defense system
MPRSYASPLAFRQALEQRLRARERQLLVFERFLARIIGIFGDAVTLKGGLALELRLARARTTKDVDLRLVGSPRDLFAELQESGRLELGDFMTYELRPDRRHPTIDNDGMRYEGLRFRAECKLAGKLFGQPFGVDVAFGDPMNGEPDLVRGDDSLAFAGIASPKLRIYPLETHVAEKLHAYTLPRARPNTRVKDLPDIALLASVRSVAARRLAEAMAQTFAFRNTHALPARLPDPLVAWEKPYATLAAKTSSPGPISPK